MRAAPIDTAVAAAFLEAVAPAEVEAWSRARKAQIQAEGALRRAEEQQVERLRYEAALAERQFNRVDPDNRLVAAERAALGGCAGCVRRAEESLGKRPAIATPSNDGQRRLDRRLQAKVLALGERLPEIWADPATRREHRKALLRCLIDKVVMHRSARDRAAVRIVRGRAAPRPT